MAEPEPEPECLFCDSVADADGGVLCKGCSTLIGSMLGLSPGSWPLLGGGSVFEDPDLDPHDG